MSFSVLSKELDWPFIQNKSPKFPSRPPESLVYPLLALHPEQKCPISSIFSLIGSTADTPASSPKHILATGFTVSSFLFNLCEARPLIM